MRKGNITASCPSFFGSNKVCGKGNIHHVGYELFSVCWMTGGDPSGIHHLSNWVISPLAGWERMKSDTSGVACREEGQSGCIIFAQNFGRTTAFATATLTGDNKWRLRGSAALLTCKYSLSLGFSFITRMESCFFFQVQHHILAIIKKINQCAGKENTTKTER